MSLQGTVLAAQANYYRVHLHLGDRVKDRDLQDLHPRVPPSWPQEFPQELLCTRRSRLKKLGQRVMVGDRVEVVEPDWQGQRGAIAEVYPRRSQLERPPVANADQLLLVFALADPVLEVRQLSQFLVMAEATGLNLLLGLSKCDLENPEVQQQWQQRLQGWGYSPICFSLHKGTGLEQLQTALGQHLTVVSGPSGVGKSSLINHLIPNLGLRTRSVSTWGRGRHTTRHVELFELNGGGLLADTPGFNRPELTVDPVKLADCFPEARQRLTQANCQFHNCLHRDEPNCAVRGDWERYPHYRDFLAELLELQQQQERRGEPETTAKSSSRPQGKTVSEPKLDLKKYRRVSRRQQQQILQQRYQEDTLAIEQTRE